MKTELNVDQIKKLWILDLIVLSGSLKGAASRAKISPSAVSQSLSSLEKSVGKPLVVRERGSITPTEEALMILSTIRPAFEAFSKLHDLGSQPVPKMDWLNFGTYESIAIDILPGLMHSLRSKMPRLRLGLRIGRTSNLLSQIRKGDLCSAIITETDDLDRFYKVEVSHDRLGIFVSSKHPIANLGWDAVEKFGLGTLTPAKDSLPRYYHRFLRKIGPVKPSVYSESFETLRAAAAGGAIASILPSQVANRLNDLVEITPADAKEIGKHKIFVVSQQNCDKEEAIFLANEARRILAQRAQREFI